MCLENVSVHTTCLSPASLEVSGSGGSLQHGVSLPASKGGSNWSKLGGGGGWTPWQRQLCMGWERELLQSHVFTLHTYNLPQISVIEN